MSTSFHQGQKIRCRGEEWQIRGAQMHEIHQVNGPSKVVWEIEAEALSGIVKGERYVFLNDIDDIELIDPADIRPVLDESKKVRRTRTFLEAHLRRLLPRNGAIYLGEHGAFQRYDYQLAPASMALDMLRPRLLIGDAVGLGKTIEAGIILSELIRRGKGRRVLAAVPKAILEQFQMEMWGRFAIPFHRLDSKGLEALRQDLPSSMNPFYHYDKAIISVDTLKLKKYQKLLEECHWDVLLIDECHNVADRTDGMGGSARHKVAKRLAQNSRSVILMSATPHDGTKYGFASLIKLIDRTLIPSDENYSPEDVSKVFIRRTRTSLRNELGDKPPRLEILEEVPLTAPENEILQSLHDIELRSTLLKGRARRGTRELFKTTLIKSFLSSPAALKDTVTKKRRELERQREKGRATAEAEKSINTLKDIVHDVDALKGKFSRVDHLLALLKKEPISNENKIVIFTERIATMNYVAEALLKAKVADNRFEPKEKIQAKGVLLGTAHGGDHDIDLNKTVKAFQSKTSRLNILVTTNVSSEGLNLHDNCHRLINFDLPWSLITLEQRAGRVDRLGQLKQPKIYYFASTAGPVTRQAPNPQKLKDDFWIVEKIQARMDQAAEDMDEEARRRFSSADEEELQNVEKYESGEISKDSGVPTDLHQLLQKMEEQRKSNPNPLKLKRLPTLFDKSPGDFVATLAEEAHLSLSRSQQSEVAIQLTKSLRHEVGEHWPREFRPSTDEICLEMDKDRMERHYKARLNSQESLDKTFMNEIHPVIHLLEHTALSLFPGNEVPVVQIEGNPGSIFFLMQGTLYNRTNEPVFQSWQVVEFERGSSTCEKFIDLHEPNHTTEIASWVRSMLDNHRSTQDLTPFDTKRISTLTPHALSWMENLVLEARKKRVEIERPRLKAELDRITKWEEERKAFLGQVISSEGKVIHGGHFAMAKNAEEELETLDRDTSAFKAFIQRYLTTDATPDIRILAIFIATEI